MLLTDFTQPQAGSRRAAQFAVLLQHARLQPRSVPWLVRMRRPTARGRTLVGEGLKLRTRPGLLWPGPTRCRGVGLPAWSARGTGADSTPIPKGTRLTGDLPQLLSTLGVGTPAIGVFFDILIGEHRLKSSPPLLQIEHILHQKPLGTKPRDEQLIDPLPDALPHRDLLPSRRSKMPGYNHSHSRQLLIPFQPARAQTLR